MTLRSSESNVMRHGRAARHRSWKIWFSSRFRSIADAEVRAVRMMKSQGADTGFRFHHHPSGQLHADFFRLEKLPEANLTCKVGAIGMAKPVRPPAMGHS